MSKERTRQPVGGQPVSFRPEQAEAASVKMFLQSVVGALNVGRLAEATRRFDDGLDRGLCPHGTNLLLWLVRGIGLGATIRLVDAYAQAACFACRHGVVLCEDCNGLARQDTGEVCPRCIGIGCTRCAVCNGSGASAAMHVPEGLYPAVLARRLDDAVEDLRHLRNCELPAADSPASHAVRGDCFRMLLEAHRLMGVFENTLLAAAEAARFPAGREGLGDRAVRASRRYGARAGLRMWRIVEVLARQAEHEARDAAPAGPAEGAARRAAFYRSLLAMPARCDGTILGRRGPFQAWGSRVGSPATEAGLPAERV